MLLRQPAHAIESLKLIACIGEIKGKRKVEDLFSKLFTGFGRIQQEYAIKLREGAKLLLSTDRTESPAH